MSKNIDLLNKRFMQITIAFMVLVAIDQFFHLPHSAWLITAGTLIYTGLYSDQIFQRAYLRFTGTLVGVAAVVIVWSLVHFNFRFAIIFLLLSIWSMVFFIAVPVNRHMIAITIFVDLVVQWTNPGDFLLQYYVVDRIVCTGFAFAVCITIEYAWFGSKNMTELYYHYQCKQLRKELKDFYRLANSNQLSNASLFKKIYSTNRQIVQLTQLINAHIFQHGCTLFFVEDSAAISQTILQEFRKIVCLFYLKNKNGDSHMIHTIQAELEHSLNQPLEHFLHRRTT